MSLHPISQNHRIDTAGPDIDQASTALILLHGRGSSARSILEFGRSIASDEMAILAPQAPDATWYPYSFLAPVDQNEPFLSNALDMLSSLVDRVLQNGMDPSQVAIGGFSQGACLALEFAARRGSPLGAVVGLSGGLIGPPGIGFEFQGVLENMVVFLGCSDRDPHIPLSRVQDSAAVFRSMGAEVDLRIYPNLGHTISADGAEASRLLLRQL